MGRPETGRDRPLSTLRNAVGPRVHRLLDRAMSARVRREVEARLEQEVGRALDERLPAIEARVARVHEEARAAGLAEPLIFGPPERVDLAGTAIVNDALLNTVSGSITIGAHAFFGHRVSVLTGTHDITRRGEERQLAIPQEGRDVHVEEGAWIGSGAIVLGPCRIGAHAVVAAGAVVTGDVAAATVVAGVPARVVRSLD
ncbi:MAG: acyltransferase [Solirubrobacteraceae bacterium]